MLESEQTPVAEPAVTDGFFNDEDAFFDTFDEEVTVPSEEADAGTETADSESQEGSAPEDEGSPESDQEIVQEEAGEEAAPPAEPEEPALDYKALYEEREKALQAARRKMHEAAAEANRIKALQQRKTEESPFERFERNQRERLQKEKQYYDEAKQYAERTYPNADEDDIDTYAKAYAAEQTDAWYQQEQIRQMRENDPVYLAEQQRKVEQNIQQSESFFADNILPITKASEPARMLFFDTLKTLVKEREVLENKPGQYYSDDSPNPYTDDFRGNEIAVDLMNRALDIAVGRMKREELGKITLKAHTSGAEQALKNAKTKVQKVTTPRGTGNGPASSAKPKAIKDAEDFCADIAGAEA